MEPEQFDNPVLAAAWTAYGAVMAVVGGLFEILLGPASFAAVSTEYVWLIALALVFLFVI